MDAKRKVTKARARLIQDSVFFGSLALRLKVVEEKDPKCKTMWTDGRSLGYNPEFVDSLSMPELVGVVCHEVMHCANQHITRRENREVKRWNKACDYAINPIIEAAGMTLPDIGLKDSQFNDMSVERIYGMLPEEKGDGDGSGDGEGDGNDPGGCGEVRDATGKDGGAMSKADTEKLEADWKIATVQAAQQAKAMGADLPDAIERMVGDIAEPKLNWREVLKRFVDTTAKNDYQWFPPNRRHIHRGVYLPSQLSHELGKVTAAIDTSGSIDQDDLDQFAGELTSILGEYGADCNVIYCDTQVRHVEEYTAYELPLDLEPHGGGGTAFIPAFEHVDESGDFPACFVYFTDGCCSQYPETPPPYPVLWIMTGNYREWGYADPPFGEVVSL